jgi:hypothetical protein
VGDLPWKNLGLKDFKPCIFKHIYVSCFIGEGIIVRVPYCGPQALLLGTIAGTPDIGAFPYTL